MGSYQRRFQLILQARESHRQGLSGAVTHVLVPAPTPVPLLLPVLHGEGVGIWEVGSGVQELGLDRFLDSGFCAPGCPLGVDTGFSGKNLDLGLK